MTNNKKIVGIYKIENLINSKVYIGQSWDVTNRWSQERSHNCHNEHLRRAIIKYGLSNFSFTMLKEFNADANVDQKYMDLYEAIYIAVHDSTNPTSGYNKKEGGRGGKHTAATKAKMSLSALGRKKSEEHKAKISVSHLGKKMSADSVARSSAAHRGRKLSAEHKAKMSASLTGKKRNGDTKKKISLALSGKTLKPDAKNRHQEIHGKPVMNMDSGLTYSTINDAAQALGISRHNVAYSLKRNARVQSEKIKEGVYFQYVLKEESCTA